MENSEPVESSVENLLRGRFPTDLTTEPRVYHSTLSHLGLVLTLPYRGERIIYRSPERLRQIYQLTLAACAQQQAGHLAFSM